MNRLLLLLAVAITFSACKKTMQQELLQNDAIAASSNITADVVPAPAYRWVSMVVPPFTRTHTYDAASDNIVFPVAGDVYCVAGENNALTEWYKLNAGTKQWQLQPNISYLFLSSHHPSHQFIFSYQNKVYAGLPYDADGIYTSAFSSFDPATNTSVQLAPFPGYACGNFTAFVTGDKGYILGGVNAARGVINQLWEYNFATNQWTNKGGSPVGARAAATAIVLDGKAYIGLGFDIVTFNNQDVTLYKNDWVLYDPSSSYSGVLAAFPGAKRKKAKGFVINGAVYLGFGLNATTGFNDFWKYNPGSNTWAQQAGYPGNSTVNNWNTSAFSIGSTGYVVKGNLAEFYRFTNSAL